MDSDATVEAFLAQSHELLDHLDTDLRALEREPGSGPLLTRALQAVRALEETSGSLAYAQLEGLTRAGTSLLTRLRDGEQVAGPDTTGALRQVVDAVRALLARIEATGAEGEPDHTALIARLTDLHPRRARVVQLPDAPALLKPVPVAQRLGEVLVETGAADPEAVLSAVLDQALGGDDRKLGEILVGRGSAQQADVDDALEAQGDRRRRVADDSTRVDGDLLDALWTLVGELVVTRDEIVRHAATRSDAQSVRSAQRLDQVVSELQEGVRRTRRQPLESVWSRVPRTVRDLSRSRGTRIRVELEGEHTELDRTVLAATRSPLAQLVRNAVDHALEPPEQRRAAGKDPEGVLRLRARLVGEQVSLEIADDGRGIDPAVIGTEALARGLVTGEQLDRMSPSEIVDLVFVRGLSTATAVARAGGRGIGLDVVRTGIERIGGTVDLQSHVGRGTTVRIRLPLA